MLQANYKLKCILHRNVVVKHM